jgi:hypothetical protein
MRSRPPIGNRVAPQSARHLDTHHVVAIGRRLFEGGGLEPLEALIDQIADQLGREPAYELVVLWTPLVEGNDGAA